MAKVLIIDSNLTSCAGIVGYLESLGFEVMYADRGDKGLAVALEKKPDLIVLDGIMPDKTGLQMLTQFRNHQETSKTPIILMSGLAQFANQQQFAKERGANEYISKPVKVIELGEMVNRYVGSKLDNPDMAHAKLGHPDRDTPINLPSEKAAPVSLNGVDTSIADGLRSFLQTRLHENAPQHKSNSNH